MTARLRIFVFVVVVASGLGIVASRPADAQTVRCVDDPSNDVFDGATRSSFPPADQLTLCYEWSESGLRVSMRVAQPLDPVTDPAWRGSSLSMTVTSVMTGNGIEATYYVDAGAIKVQARPIAFRTGEDYTCSGTGGVFPSGYVMDIPWDCFRFRDQMRVAGRTVFRPDGHIYNDPHNDGVCCAPSAPAAPAATTTTTTAPPAPAASPGQLTHGARLNGGGSADPIGQAIATAQNLFPNGSARRVVLATADRFPDALSGSALAGPAGPVLFTSGLGALDERTRAEIARVTGGDAVVLTLGGTAAVSEEAAQQARAAAGNRPCAAPLPTSCRFAGATREETAALAAETVIAEHPRPANQPQTVLVARSDDFADALTGGAFAARAGVPILLTPTTRAHPAAASVLQHHAPVALIALGGTAAISDETLRALPAESRQRVAGAERTATAAEISKQLWRARGMGQGGVALVNVFAANGWQTALSAAVASAKFDAPQIGLQPPPATLSSAARAELAALKRPAQGFGDPNLVSDRQISEATATVQQ